MSDDTVQTSWKRFTDRVKGLWSDHLDEAAPPPAQLGTGEAPAERSPDAPR